MIGELASDAVEDRCDKFSSEAEVTAELLRKLLGVVILIRKIPLKLINLKDKFCNSTPLLNSLCTAHQTDVSNMNIELEDNSLVLLLAQ